MNGVIKRLKNFTDFSSAQKSFPLQRLNCTNKTILSMFGIQPQFSVILLLKNVNVAAL